MASNPICIMYQTQQSTNSPHLASLFTPQQLAIQKGVREKAVLKVEKDAKQKKMSISSNSVNLSNLNFAHPSVPHNGTLEHRLHPMLVIL
jgi:hypothetical protein